MEEDAESLISPHYRRNRSNMEQERQKNLENDRVREIKGPYHVSIKKTQATKVD